MSCWSNIRTVFVDIDDTVWWFTENSRVALRHVYDHFGLCRLEPAYDRFRDIYMAKNKELWLLYHHGRIDKQFLLSERFGYTLRRIGAGETEAGTLASAVDTEYLRFLALQPRLVPGARQLLTYLNGKYAVHALSNGFKGVQEQKLRSAGISHLIDKVIISDNCGYTKPMRGIFDYALAQTGADARTTVMIGDNDDADIGGAAQAGWHTIYFDIKGTGPSAQADATVTALEQIKALL